MPAPKPKPPELQPESQLAPYHASSPDTEEATRDYALPSHEPEDPYMPLSPVGGEEPKVHYPYAPPDYHQPEPEPPAEHMELVPAARPFPPRLADAVWVLIDAVRADPTYARNLRVRLATFQGNDVGPLTALLDAMAANETA